MSHTRLLISAAIIIVIVLIVFTISVPRTRDVQLNTPEPEKTVNVPLATLSSSFKKGLYTISGSVEAPNACTTVSASASVGGNASSTESILVEVLTQTDSGVCLQIPTRVSFETTISAPANLPLTLIVNGVLATTTSL
jgi:hypothetical protein